MIQNAAMFQEVAPVAAMPPGRATAFGGPAGRAGAFAQVLQGARSGEDGAPKSGASDGAAVTAQGAGQTADAAKAGQAAGESAGKEGSVAKPEQVKGPEAAVPGSELQGALPAVEWRQVTAPAEVAQSGAAMVAQAVATATQGVETATQAVATTAQGVAAVATAMQGVATATAAATQGVVVPAHAGTADKGQEVSRPASPQAAAGQMPAPAARQAVQDQAVQDQAAVTTTGSNARQESGAVAASADTAQTRPTLVWSAAQSERVVPAQPGTANNGQEVSRLASQQAAQKTNPVPASPQEAQKPATQDPAAAIAITAQQGKDALAQQTGTGVATADGVPQPRTGAASPVEVVQLGPATVGPAEKAEPAPAQAEPGQEVSQPASPRKAEVKEPAPAVAAQDSTATAGSTARQESAAAPGARTSGATAGGFVPTPAPGASFQAALATPASNAVNAVKQAPSGTGQVAALPAVETQAAGAPLEGDAAVLPGEARQGTATGATEGVPREVTASGGKLQGQAATGPVAQQQPVTAATAQAEAAPSPEKATQPVVDGKYAKAAQGAESQAAANEQAAVVAPQASAEEVAGSKTASALSEKPGLSRGNSGQDQPGDAGKQGHPGQKAQGEQNGQVQSASLGTQTPAAAETAQPEPKPENHRSALHQNILSQVKDGVVTHDGKGNGQMSIRLNPGELGELKIQVRMEDNRLRIEVQADNRMVKDLLMSNLESLKEALSSKNFTMAGFDVSTGGGGFNSPLPEERRNSRQQSLLRTARAGGYPGQEESRVNYLTGDVNNLLDVRF